jgi:hypothetical protein
MFFPSGLIWICFAPFALASLGILAAIGLVIVRWVNEPEKCRVSRTLWVVLWLCGVLMLVVASLPWWTR